MGKISSCNIDHPIKVIMLTTYNVSMYNKYFKIAGGCSFTVIQPYRVVQRC